MTKPDERIEWYDVAIYNQKEAIIEKLVKEKKEFIKELKEWYLITTGEISELMELGERYKDVFYAVQDRVIELGEKIKKWGVEIDEL